jgi:hypothetical protein
MRFQDLTAACMRMSCVIGCIKALRRRVFLKSFVGHATCIMMGCVQLDEEWCIVYGSPCGKEEITDNPQ